MASNINSADVDALYPIAGQDNDSQGFRDNFSTIKNSLATASTEITALQDKTAGVAATAIEENGSTVGGDWNGYYIQDANFRANVEEVYSIGNALTSLNVNWTNGHYQTIQAGADITCTLTEWPTSGKLGKMRLAVTGDGEDRDQAAGGPGQGEGPGQDTGDQHEEPGLRQEEECDFIIRTDSHQDAI